LFVVAQDAHGPKMPRKLNCSRRDSFAKSRIHRGYFPA
jgi:hypothetical protein